MPVAALVIILMLLVGTFQAATTNGGSFFGISIPPWMTGQNGGGSGSNIPPTAIIPSGAVRFKMVAVAENMDGTNTTVFEQSTLPAFATVSVHGKAVKGLTASAIAAIQLDEPVPSDARAKFNVNFTVWISKLNKVKWSYTESTTPLIRNGTLAFVLLPTMSVATSEVFPSAGSASETRTVTFAIDGHVTILSGQQLPLFSLVGSTFSSADFNADGSVVVCTDCGGGGSGGITLTPTGGETRYDDPCWGPKPEAWCNPESPQTESQTRSVGGQTTQGASSALMYTSYVNSATYTNTQFSTVAGQTCNYNPNGYYCNSVTQTETVPATQTVKVSLTKALSTAQTTYSTIVSVTTDSRGNSKMTIRTIDKNGNVLDESTVETLKGYGTKGSGDGATPIKWKGAHMYVESWLSRFDLGGTTYIVNFSAILVALIAGLAGTGILVLGFLVFKATLGKKRKRR